MTDLTLLDGTVEDVAKGLAGLADDDFAALLAAERAGKTRKGVIDAIEEARAKASTKGVTYSAITDRGDGANGATTTNVGMPAASVTTAASLDQSGPANIDPATTFAASGAPLQAMDIDLGAASLDANPRANTSVDQNRIDFNDPVRTGAEIVADQLRDQAEA